PPAADIVKATLPYIPTEALIRHEWAAHGTCSGLSAADYFAALRKVRDSIRIPPELEAVRKPIVVSPQEIESVFGGQNAGIPRDGFRVSCYPDGALKEVRICFDRNLTPHGCTGSTECTRQAVRLQPTPGRR